MKTQYNTIYSQHESHDNYHQHNDYQHNVIMQHFVPLKEINNYSETQTGGSVYTEGIIINKVTIRNDKSQNPFVVAYLRDPADDVRKNISLISVM